MCNKSGENLLIYSEPSYERGSGHSPKPPTQNRQCGDAANGEAERGEENKQQWEELREDTLEARLTACASDEFHNLFSCHEIEMPTTERRLTWQLGSTALNYCSKSNISTHNLWLGAWTIWCKSTCASMSGWCKCRIGCSGRHSGRKQDIPIWHALSVPSKHFERLKMREILSLVTPFSNKIKKQNHKNT